MSSDGDRKRKGSVSEDGEIDTSTSRLTKQLKAPAPVLPPPGKGGPSLLDLPAGVVAKIALFSRLFSGIGKDDAGENSRDNSSCDNHDALMTLCIVFGREVARDIRFEYLHKNMSYLEFLHDEMARLVEDASNNNENNVEVCQDIENHLSLVSPSLEQWMEANDWWKDACRESQTFFLKGPERTTANYPTITKRVVLKEFANESEKREFGKRLCVGVTNNIAAYEHNDGDDGDSDEDCSGRLEEAFQTIVAVGNINLKGMEFSEAKALLLSEGEKELCVRHTKFDGIFFIRL